jgi:hypothetical protein
MLEKEHRCQAAARGVEDAESWKSYAELLQVYFWEQVLSDRYSSADRISQFMTQMEAVLGEVLDLSVARVQKLRKWLHGLQAGSLRSLRGKR